MEFLDEIIWNNSVRQYVVSFSIIALVFLLKGLLSRLLARFIFIPIKQTWKIPDQTPFLELIIRPLGWFVAVLISVIVLYKLNLPDFLQFKLYGIKSAQIFHKLAAGILVVLFIRCLLSIIDFIAFMLERKNRDIEKRGHNQLIPFFRDLLKVILGIFGLLLFISAVFNKNMGSMLTGLSIVGAALALSAKESLENLIASFIIFFDKPFYVGDAVKANNVSGTVEEIGLRSTRIRTLDKSLVSVPNKQMVDNIVDNQSMQTHRKTVFQIDIDTQTEPGKLKSFLAQAQEFLQNHPEVSSGFVHVTGYSSKSITITVEFFVVIGPYDAYLLMKENVIFELIERIHKNEIQLATDHSNITVTRPGTEPPATPKKDNLI